MIRKYKFLFFIFIFSIFFIFIYNNYSYIYFKEKAYDETAQDILKSFVFENKYLFNYTFLDVHSKYLFKFYYCYNKTYVYNNVLSDLYLFNFTPNNFFSYKYIPCFRSYYYYTENEGYPLTGKNIIQFYFNNSVLPSKDVYPHYYSYVYVFKFGNFTDAKKTFDFLSYVFNSEDFNKHFLEHYFYKNVSDIPFYTNVNNNYKDLFYYKNFVLKDNYSFFHHTLVILYDDKILVSKTFTNSSTIKYYVSSTT